MVDRREILTMAEEEFRAWEAHPVTKQVLLWANRRREALKESWASGELSAAFDMEMAVKNAGATGYCSAMKELIELKYEDLHEATDNE